MAILRPQGVGFHVRGDLVRCRGLAIPMGLQMHSLESPTPLAQILVYFYPYRKKKKCSKKFSSLTVHLLNSISVIFG